MKNRRSELPSRSTPSAPGTDDPRGRGYSLLELLVAMSIMVILGTGLIVLLKQGVTTWHVAEKRAMVYERGRMVLDQVGEDLRSACSDSSAEGAGFWIRFLCDHDRQGRQRLRFTRAISGEMTDPLAREGGSRLELADVGHYDHHGDAAEAAAGRLLAPRGYQEVLYCLDPKAERTFLWRGIRSPIGGAGSLFIDRNIEEEPDATKSKKRTAAGLRSPQDESGNPGIALADGPAAQKEPAPKELGKRLSIRQKAAAGKKGAGHGKDGHPPPAPPPAAPFDPGALPPAQRLDLTPIERAARPFSEGILHLSFAFWTRDTSTWDRTVPALTRKGTRKGERCGPVLTWDSTRAILDEKAAGETFAWRSVPGSLEDPSDDIFPERVEVTLVVAGNADVQSIALAAEIGPSDRLIPLSRTEGLPTEGPERFVRIGGEWIAYEKVERGQLIISAGKEAGRGARGSTAAGHGAGTTVEVGTTFRRVIQIPAMRLGRVEGIRKGGRP